MNILGDPTTWIVSFSGVGPVTLGSSLTTDSSAFPGFQDVTDELCRPLQLYLVNANRLSVLLSAPAAEPEVARTIVLSSQTYPDEPTPLSPRTVEGIGLGSTLDQLQAAYPGIERTGWYGAADHVVYYGMSSPGGTWMVFNLLGGAVSSIQLGPAKTMPPEFCPA